MQAIDITGLSREDVALLSSRPTSLSIDPETGIGTPVGLPAARHGAQPGVRKVVRKTKKSCKKMNRNIELFGHKIYNSRGIFQPQHLPIDECVKRLARKEGDARLDFMEQCGADHFIEKVLPDIAKCGLSRTSRLPLIKDITKFIKSEQKKGNSMHRLKKTKRSSKKHSSHSDVRDNSPPSKSDL